MRGRGGRRMKRRDGGRMRERGGLVPSDDRYFLECKLTVKNSPEHAEELIEPHGKTRVQVPKVVKL